MKGLVLLGCFDDALEMFRPFGPGEGRWVLAVVLQIAEQKILQIFLGMMDSLGQCLAGQDTEKAFNHVHPGSVRCRVVEVHSRMTQEPLRWRPVRPASPLGAPASWRHRVPGVPPGPRTPPGWRTE